MALARYPVLFQINTRVWLTELGRALGRPATLDDIPDAALDRLAEQRFDWVWFLSVWQIGLAGQQVSRRNPEWRREFQDTLLDLDEDDIAHGRELLFDVRAVVDRTLARDLLVEASGHDLELEAA